MNILDGRWSKFKKELLPIIFLSTIQIWWSFNLPAFIRQGVPWSIILAVSMSIVGIASTIFSFSFADKFAPYFNLDYLDAAPFGPILKKIEMIILVVIAHVAIFLVWYKDFYHMSNIHYAISYTTCLITFVLLYRAMYRGSLQA